MVVTKTNPVRHFESYDGFERRPVYEHQRIAGGDLIAAFKQHKENEPSVVKLINEEHRVITVEPNGSECSLCSDNEAYTPGRGTPTGTAQRKRKAARCVHAEVASNLPFVEQCECGGLEVMQRGPATKKVSPTDICTSCESRL
jgi:hypothetical protein